MDKERVTTIKTSEIDRYEVDLEIMKPFVVKFDKLGGDGKVIMVPATDVKGNVIEGKTRKLKNETRYPDARFVFRMPLDRLLHRFAGAEASTNAMDLLRKAGYSGKGEIRGAKFLVKATDGRQPIVPRAETVRASMLKLDPAALKELIQEQAKELGLL